MKTKLFTLIGLSLLSACGGGGGGSQSAPPELRSHSDTPEVFNVSVSPRMAEALPGTTLEGRYTFFSSSYPASLDGSSFHWETSDHTTISHDKTYTVSDDDALVGDSIRFCVTPTNRGDRKQGAEVCSDAVQILEQPEQKPVQILITDLTSESKLFAYSKYDNLPVDGVKYIWRAAETNAFPVDSQYFKYQSDDEGHSVEACVVEKDTSKLLGCSLPYTVQPIKGSAPTVNVEDFDNIVKSGRTVTLKYTFNDEDGDKEDRSKSLYTWYVGEQKQSNHGQTFTPDKSMAFSTLKGCVTPYSKTGTPKAGEETCNQKALIYSSDPSAPEASELHISGLKFEGQKVTGSYKYFDKNHDPESNSEYEWRIHRGTDTDDYQVVSRDLSYTLQLGDEGRGNTIEFCVTPHDTTALGSQGNQTCIQEDIAWFEGKGRFDETGKVVPILKGYPSFNSSHWESVDGETTWFIGTNKPEAFDGTNPFSASFRGLPVKFCVSMSKNGSDTSGIFYDNICREMKTYPGNKDLTFNDQSLTGELARVFDANDATRIAFPYKVNDKVTEGGKTKTFYWPITWEQLETLPGRDWQAAGEKYRHGLVDYVKMAPNEARNFCSSFYPGGTIPMMRNVGDWVPNRPNFFDDQDLEVLKWGQDGKIYSKGDYIDGTVFDEKLADLNKKYLFSCVSPSADIN
ncbi:hypothetical protein CS022_10220 [Veronia nyctiphanis]|uniref:Lipoprotein n=1 Tax=Veronia nyctiphanis TaxID=1278244 RepID=A0A4Q0YT61_9GAMM|nr:hypothetical protein [Veronia nyctiphanis]RXJ73344.1 hypothetical protein CS022_10220 [Veronia nyctiphanis]